MIVDERLVTYINSLDTGNTEILDEIEREALETYVPIVRKEMQSFLKLILSIKRPLPIAIHRGTGAGDGCRDGIQPRGGEDDGGAFRPFR